MSEQTTAQLSPAAQAAGDPAIFKVLDDGTVLYKTFQQAETARQQQTAGKSTETAKKLSQVKNGEQYIAKDGHVVPYTLGHLVEFQFTGLIVVLVVLAGLSLICMAIGRLIRTLERSAAPATAPATIASSPEVPAAGIHPGLTDQQLVVLMTAAAHEVLGAPVLITGIRPLTAKNSNWSAKGRSDLHSHRLK